MRRRSPTAVAMAGVAVVIAINVVTLPPRAAAGGLFGDIFRFFGASNDRRFAPMTAYTDPTEPGEKRLDLHAPPAVSPSGTTYCVRLCDGRYFPLSPPAAASRTGAAKLCSAMCPAAQTAIFHGGDIDHAYGMRGERYADLAHAFVYRERVVADCTCNGRDAFGLAPMDIASDPTLRAGDMVATRSGLEVFTGSRSAARKTAKFRPVRRENVAPELRRILAGMQVSRRN